MGGTRDTGRRHQLVRLAEQVRTAVFASPLYALTLRGAAPTHLALVPHDPWPGDADAGAEILQGRFRFAGQTLRFDAFAGVPAGATAPWLGALHGFDWLRDLRALGGDQARRQARALVSGWLDGNALWSLPAWDARVAGARIAAWIGQHDFFCASADDAFRARVFDSLARQARHLMRTAHRCGPGQGGIAALKGLVYAGLCLPGLERAHDLALRLLERELPRQVLADGGHASRSPSVHLCVLRDLIDIRAVLRQARRPVPDALQQAVERMTPALRFFRHGDGGLAMFNGTDEDAPVLIDTVLAQADARGRPLRSAPQTGFERILAGRTLLIMDTGAPPPPGLDAHAHAGTLAFELSCGRDRVVVNCGTVPGAVGPWRRTLAGTAAHSTVVLGDRNSSEVLEAGGLGRRRAQVACERTDGDGATLVEAAHDGYVPGFGTVHRRRIFVADSGDDIRGEDTLDGPGGHPFAVRFHLHPSVQVSVEEDGNAALLRLPGGQGWRLRAGGAALEVQESLYVGSGGNPRRTQQLVLAGTTEPGGTVVKWAFQREKRPG